MEETSYTVAIYSDGQFCGEYTVLAPRVGLAQTRAMVEMFARIDKGVSIPFRSGSFVTYATEENS